MGFLFSFDHTIFYLNRCR